MRKHTNSTATEICISMYAKEQATTAANTRRKKEKTEMEILCYK
jgi:hypothetical protein